MHVNAVIDASGPGALIRMESISLRGLQLSLTLQGSHTFRQIHFSFIHDYMHSKNCRHGIHKEQFIGDKTFSKASLNGFQHRNTHEFSRRGKRDKY